MSEYPYLLNGVWLSEGTKVEVRSPYDQSVIGVTWNATPKHLDAAIAASVAAFEVTRRMSAYERQSVLLKVVRGIEEQRETISRTIAMEAGKPITAARVEVERALMTFQTATEECVRIEGTILPQDHTPSTKGQWGVVRKFPVGPIAAITPFNFPFNLVAHKVAPAMAVGCTVVLKPAPQTPLSALILARIIHEAEWPAGALNVLPLRNEDAKQLIEDDRLKLLSFTGSAAVGWQLKSQCRKKKIVLELGGNAACIVNHDANVEDAAAKCVIGGFGYAGQSCISVQRIFVHRKKIDDFLAALLARVSKLMCGDPMNETTDVGPLIRDSDAKRVVRWVEEAVHDGAKLHCGGKRNGSVVEPTVLANTNPQQKVNCEEIFGPVVTVEPFDDFEAVIERVNDSPFGLQTGVFTNDLKALWYAFERLDVGGVIHNMTPTFRLDAMPYGGVKDSGLGREGVRYAMEDMLETKLLVLNPTS